ncbi:hypothetical protein FIE12Z_890 [Fusarium flagelliforme]|uniref:Uncharacterized protein n=1 Tax=Fusarium flagelliforme TaxID=2675880 RepID=A0A395N3V0_9HYPO|nr:hypothetical protein FIE12Z_890 [Fusarium flagelliforme]
MSANNQNTNNKERKLYIIKSTTRNQEPSLSIFDLDGTGEWDGVKGCYVSPEKGREVFFKKWVLEGANRRLVINLHPERDPSVPVVWHKKDQAIQNVFEHLRVGEEAMQNNITPRLGCLRPVEGEDNISVVDYDWDRFCDIDKDEGIAWADAKSVRVATRYLSGGMHDITTASTHIRRLVNQANCGFDLVARN